MQVEMTEARRLWLERWAIKLAVGNNGGTWATHYVEKQKEFWRVRARELIAEFRSELDAEAANFDGMSEYASRQHAKYSALGEMEWAAYWKGRARGLRIAAHSLHIGPELDRLIGPDRP